MLVRFVVLRFGSVSMCFGCVYYGFSKLAACGLMWAASVGWVWVFRWVWVVSMLLRFWG